MRRPKGIKTKKSAAKRFKITAGGKVLRSSAGKRHLCQSKSAKRRRTLRRAAALGRRSPVSRLPATDPAGMAPLAHVPYVHGVSRPVAVNTSASLRIEGSTS